jgi:low affinity Fe/Cu permease
MLRHKDSDAQTQHPVSRLFSVCASAVAHATGKPLSFAICLGIVVVWAASGPLFGFSDTWQLVINTGTTIITFLMVFLIQNTQNRDGAAIQAKLDELISSSAAQNSFVGIEHLTEEELEELRAKIATRAKAKKLHAAHRAGERASERANKKAAHAAHKATSG